MSFLVRLSGVATLTVAIAVSLFGSAQAAAPILIKSCTIVKPKPLSHNAGGTNIVYVNLGHKTISDVTFAVGYRNAANHYIRRVTDVGSFAPGATINHTFSLYNDVTYAGAATTMCAPVSVKYSDATLWIAPSKP
jgi:hypothetical protein